MASLNKVQLIGNLGKDPEVRFTGSGQAVANFPIATTEKWKNKDGQWEEKTEWHNIVVWGKLAELCREYLNKGRPVYVEGKLQTRSWQDKDGNKRYTTEIVGQAVQFLGAPTGKSGAMAGSDMGAGAQSIDSVPTPPPFDESDDIPF
jgi:single-strand DNA-binding protein